MTTNGDGSGDWKVRRGETGKTELKTRPSGWRRAALGSLPKVILSPADLHPSEKHKARAVEHLSAQQINMA